MLLTLVLLAQSAPDLAASKLAMDCARANRVVGKADHAPVLRTHAISVTYAIFAAQADQRGKLLVERTTEIAQGDTTALPSIEEARALMPTCDAHFPVARSTAVTLPTNPFERDVMCDAVVSVMGGIANGARGMTGDAQEPLRWKRIAGIFGARITDAVLATHGIRDAGAAQSLMDRKLGASLAFGNVQAVSLACEKLIDG